MKTFLSLWCSIGCLLVGLTNWGSATVLSDQAAQTQPGTWKDITSQLGGFGTTLLQTIPGAHINEYADKGVWNPNTREAFFVGASHANTAPGAGEKFIRFSDATNAWNTISALPSPLTYQAHSYQHNAIDTSNGDIYYRIYNTKRLLRYRGGSWSDMASIPMGAQQVAGALEGFPERQSLLFIDGDWGVWSYSIASNSWTLLAETNGNWGTSLPKLPMGAYHNVAVYSPIHKIILFGGGNGSATLYRINQSGVITTETTAPTPVGINSTIFTVDPASGDYLLFSNDRRFWKYNPSTKTWAQLPSSQHPPFFSTASDGPARGTVAFPISTYGVVMFTTWNTSASKVYLYKHAPGSSSSDTTAPTVSMTAPAANSTVSGTVAVSANASDNVGVSGVQFKLDGVNLATEDTSAPYSVSWNTTSATQGTHTLTAVARDATGNTTTATAVTVTVNNLADTTPPSVSVTAPAAGATVSGTVNVSANATDNVSVSGVQFKLDGVNLGTEDTTTPYSVSWDTKITVNGIHTLTAVARDAAGNVKTATTLSVTVNNIADTTAPTVPTNLTATPASSSQINLTWAASTDNVGVTGYKVYRGGAQVGTTTSTSYSDSSLAAQTNYTYKVQAYDAAGNNSAQSAAASATTLSGGTQSADFAARCSAPGVLKCVSFDNASDIAGTFGNVSGILTGSVAPALDTTVKASGASALKFTIPSNSGAGASGSYFTNFTDDLSTLFGEGEEFYIQWRQRFSAEFLSTNYTDGGGWKQVIIGEGDRPGCNPTYNTTATCVTSCTQLEIVVQNTYQRGIPQMYHSCGGKDGRYEPLDVVENQKIYPQYAVGLNCVYPGPYTEPSCVLYKPDQWLTFQVHVKIGTWYKNDRNYHRDSTIQMWVAEEGQPPKLVVDRSPQSGQGYDIANTDSTAPLAEYGKVWLLPYHTGKNASQSHPTGYVWYDELIISRNKIADPGNGNSGPVRLEAPTNLTVTAN